MPGEMAPAAIDRSSTRIMTRAEVAAELGVSKPTVRRMEGRDLHPKKGPRGVRVFDAMEVRRVVTRRLTARVGAPEVDGTMAATVFAALEKGTDPVAVVVEHALDPRQVIELQALRARLRGGLQLSPETLRALRGPDALGVDVASEAELLAAVRAAAAPPPCGRCGTRPIASGLCAPCRRSGRQRSGRAEEASE